MRTARPENHPWAEPAPDAPFPAITGCYTGEQEANELWGPTHGPSSASRGHTPLTHQPKKTDTIDSITRQIIRKVILLNNRWDPHIDYGPFQGAKQDTIWSAMYSYRSSLAHGGAPDFNGELNLLGNGDQALKLLKYTVKGVLRQSLIEPRLIVDLRNC